METQKQVITSQRLGESYQEINHPSGLKILLYPMEGFSGTYALFATKYGSVDTCFKTQQDGDFLEVPAGIAHFLEHKLFENEEGDAFALYAKTGASANAYTSFDRTAYLFSCTENVSASMDILLNFVTHPYFTEQTVQKEQGIIGQEIQMYEDNPDWRVFFNLLGALYHHHPVHLDIAGTIESIAKIDAALLYRCYHTFYNLHNMVLAVAGNFSPEEILASADRHLQTAAPIEIQRRSKPEPRTVRTAYVQQNLPVATPMFSIGFKGKPGTEIENARGQICDEILLEMIAGESTPLYRRLYDAGLINQTFGGEGMSGSDYSLTMFSGESRDPQKVYDAIIAEVRRMQQEGLDDDTFARCRNAIYGRYIGVYGRIDSVAGMMVSTQFSGMGLYEPLDRIAELTKEQLENRMRESFDPDHSALSVIRS